MKAAGMQRRSCRFPDPIPVPSPCAQRFWGGAGEAGKPLAPDDPGATAGTGAGVFGVGSRPGRATAASNSSMYLPSQCARLAAAREWPAGCSGGEEFPLLDCITACGPAPKTSAAKKGNDQAVEHALGHRRSRRAADRTPLSLTVR